MIVNLENEIYIYLFSLMKILNCLIRQNSVQRINDVLLIEKTRRNILDSLCWSNKTWESKRQRRKNKNSIKK